MVDLGTVRQDINRCTRNRYRLSHLLKISQRRRILSTYRDVVTVGPVAVTPIRKLSAVRDFSLGFDIFISSVTHGPSSIV